MAILLLTGSKLTPPELETLTAVKPGVRNYIYKKEETEVTVEQITPPGEGNRTTNTPKETL